MVSVAANGVSGSSIEKGLAARSPPVRLVLICHESPKRPLQIRQIWPLFDVTNAGPYGHQDQKRQNIGAKNSAIVSKPAETCKPFIVLCESSVFLFQGKRLDGGSRKSTSHVAGAASSLLHFGNMPSLPQ